MTRNTTTDKIIFSFHLPGKFFQSYTILGPAKLNLRETKTSSDKLSP